MSKKDAFGSECAAAPAEMAAVSPEDTGVEADARIRAACAILSTRPYPIDRPDSNRGTAA